MTRARDEQRRNMRAAFVASPKTPCDLSPRTDSGSNMARSSQRRALLGVLPPPVVPPVPSNAARPAPTSGTQR